MEAILLMNRCAIGMTGGKGSTMTYKLCVYIKGKSDKKFRANWVMHDTFEDADRMLERLVRSDKTKRGTIFQIRENGRKILREVEC
jgi:hypothetical protein